MDNAPTFDKYSSEFRKGLEHAINCHSMENGSNTPDFVLAQYLVDCLASFDKAAQHRDAYYGRPFYNGDAPPPSYTGPTLSAV